MRQLWCIRCVLAMLKGVRSEKATGVGGDGRISTFVDVMLAILQHSIDESG
jgi:hypothetical protein